MAIITGYDINNGIESANIRNVYFMVAQVNSKKRLRKESMWPIPVIDYRQKLKMSTEDRAKLYKKILKK